MNARVHRLAALAAVFVLGASLLAWARPAAAVTVHSGDVTLTVLDVSPSSPAVSSSPQPLKITLELQNNTNRLLKDVVISGSRSDPITTQSALDGAIAKPKPPSSNLVAPLGNTYRYDLAPRSSADVFFTSTTDVRSDSDLHLYANAIYPLYFTADYNPPNAATQRLAVAQTYVPSFTSEPAKLRVGWVWPLLDRPHRLLYDSTFLDDDLAEEVSPGGRLDQMLSVVEQVGAQVPMTLITDPELIDELAVMSNGYRVRTSAGTVPGTGSAAASAWLARLRQVLAQPHMEISLTPPADPAVESLHRAQLSWTVGLSAAARIRVVAALGGTLPPTDISWPAEQTLSAGTLGTLAAQGVKSVVASDKVLPKNAAAPIVPNALAPLQTASGRVTAAVTSTSLNRWVKAVLSARGTGLAALPELVAETAMRTETSLTRSHYVVLIPPRDLDLKSVDVAVRAIRETADSPWSSPLPLRAAIATVAPVSHGRLRPERVSVPNLPPRSLLDLNFVTQSLPEVGALFTVAADRAAALGRIPAAVQRAESSAFLYDRDTGAAYADKVADQLRRLANRVTLVRPSTGSYTLASQNSSLPITIANHLAAPVRVVITLSSTPGFSAKPVAKTIPANSTTQVRVPTHVNRVGRFDVDVDLATTTGFGLTGSLRLTVHSTALGTIGVVITVVAAVILVLALLIRFARRMHKRRAPSEPTAQQPAPAPAGAP